MISELLFLVVICVLSQLSADFNDVTPADYAIILAAAHRNPIPPSPPLQPVTNGNQNFRRPARRVSL